MGKEETEAQLKLANAMDRLADRLEAAMDPLRWQRMLNDAYQALGPIMPQIPPPTVPVAAAIEGIRVEVTLSQEERERMAERLFEAVKPELEQFQDFVKESLKEMPPYKLREMAQLLEQGKKARLGRRRGCVFMEFDEGQVFYLGL